jgi:hypothetical protein
MASRAMTPPSTIPLPIHCGHIAQVTYPLPCVGRAIVLRRFTYGMQDRMRYAATSVTRAARLMRNLYRVIADAFNVPVRSARSFMM